ncbi:MAG TPA: hypothetical protein VHP11_14340, partial [Tepidisphaeraceae bacterium]|nr:hypothetical protein [Tepidisphaeraceae bacterium]
GVILLAVVTSLPEIARTVTASLEQRPEIVIDSLFGGMVLLMAVLAVADGLVARKQVLTFFAPTPVLLLQGAILVLLLGIAVAGAAVGEVFSLFGIGLWVAVIFAVYLLSLFEMRSFESREPWRPTHLPEEATLAFAVERGLDKNRGLRQTLFLIFLTSVIVFVTGILVTQSGIALAEETGLGTGFVGATLLAFVAALPEMSVTFAAVRFGAYTLAISNIFGTAAFMVALLFLGDVFYSGPLLSATSNAAIFAMAAAVVTTAIYLIGMLERRNRTVFGMGIDSLAVLVTYGITLAVLYSLR